MNIKKPEATMKEFIYYALLILLPSLIFLSLRLESLSGLYFTFGTMIYLIVFLLGKYGGQNERRTF